MPQRDYKDIDVSNISQTRREPGYDWIPDRFGPPPGIPRREKERLDNLADKEYVNAVLRKPIDDIESLMVSEAERRRSFRSTWSFEYIVKGVELAKAGFYFLNSADRVKCAFCSGVVRQWNKGDRPMERHKRYFSFCKLAQGKARDNIPFNETDVDSLLMHMKSNSRTDPARQQMDSEGINVKTDPARPEYRMHQRREQTFGQSWPPELRQLVPKICYAGFFLAGPGDRCACFFCGGTLEDWTTNDDPWAEHAKWYFRCPYLLENKGGDYVRMIRATMSDQDRHESENLKYNTSNLNPEKAETQLDVLKKRKRMKKVRKYLSYNYALTELEYPDDLIIQAYQVNDWNEYENPEDLLKCMFKIMDREIDPFVHKNEQPKMGSPELPAMQEKDLIDAIINGDELTDSMKNLPIDEYLERQEKELSKRVASGGELTDFMNYIFIKKLTCLVCYQETCGAIFLPCCCFSLCKTCCKEKLPEKCPRCSSLVKGALRCLL